MSWTSMHFVLFTCLKEVAIKEYQKERTFNRKQKRLFFKLQKASFVTVVVGPGQQQSQLNP